VDLTGRPPLFRMMMGNASLLSLVYLGAGLLVEVVRRAHPAPWVLQLTLVLDSLPARTLSLFGAMEPLRDAYGYGFVSEEVVRLIFSGTTILIIFAMAVVVGAGLWLIRRLFVRLSGA
jgi:hypothetical protein